MLSVVLMLIEPPLYNDLKCMYITLMYYYFSECPPGYTGTDCKFQCYPPYYGAGCLQKCHCPMDLCDAVSGCKITSTTGKPKCEYFLLEWLCPLHIMYSTLEFVAGFYLSYHI